MGGGEEGLDFLVECLSAKLFSNIRRGDGIAVNTVSS